MEKIAEFPNEYEFEAILYDHTPIKKIKCNKRQISNENKTLQISTFEGIFKSTNFKIRKIDNGYFEDWSESSLFS